MANQQDVREALSDFVRRYAGSALSICKVISVNKNEATCDVSPIDNEDLVWHDVRLQALPQSGLLILPAAGSYVVAGELGQSQGRCVLQFSAIDKVYLSAESGIEFNGGMKGEMVELGKVKARLNAIENDINTLKNIFSLWVPPTNNAMDNGAILRAAASEWCGATLTVTSDNDLANNQIKQ